MKDGKGSEILELIDNFHTGKAHDQFFLHLESLSAEDISRIRDRIGGMFERGEVEDTDGISLMRILVHIKDERSEDIIIDALHYHDDWINDLAVQALDAIGSRRCVPELVRARLRASYGVSQRMEKVLEKMKPVDELLAIFKEDDGGLMIGATTDLLRLEEKEPGTLDLEKARKAVQEAPEKQQRIAAECYLRIVRKLGEKIGTIDMPGELLGAKPRPPKGRIFREGRVAHV